MAQRVMVHWADIATIVIFSATSRLSGVYFGELKMSMSVTVLRAIHVLPNDFFLKFGTHRAPRNANNIEP